ncbi:MAG: LamG-like jellyroll fold domain-containing protein [Candidatus Woesearchaeota archaeon]
MNKQILTQIILIFMILILIITIISPDLIKLAPKFIKQDYGLREDYNIEKYNVLKMDFVSSNSYSSGNPFTDVDFTIEFTNPTGQRILNTDGFYNGNGNGDQNGYVWSARFSGDEVGTWTYETFSNEPSLNGLTGTINVQISSNKGPIIKDEEYPHWFKFKEGENVQLHGNFLDNVAGGNPLRFTHLYLSEFVSDTERQQFIDRANQIKANKMNIYLANVGDYGGSFPTTPWLGTYNSNNKERFDILRWEKYEVEIARLNQEGIIAELWFFADDSAFGNINDANIDLFLQYGLSRLSAYPNVIFVQVLEWEEMYSNNWNRANNHGIFMSQHNPYERSISIHGTTGNFDFPNEEWTKFMAIQTGNTVSYPSNYDMTLVNYNLPNNPKPLINEEFGFNNDDYDQNPVDSLNMRKKLWIAFVAGTAGTGTGSGMKEFDEFFDLVNPEFWKMTPDDSVFVTAGYETHCLANSGQSYICYAPVGGTIQLNSNSIQEQYNYLWYDPFTGVITEQGFIDPGNLILNAPNSNDWVLFLDVASQQVSTCNLIAEPDREIGSFNSLLTASFENLPPDITLTLMKCSQEDGGTQQIINNNIATRSCNYPEVLEETTYQASATAEETQCITLVTDLPIPPENVFQDDYTINIYSNDFINQLTIDNVDWDHYSNYYPLGGGEIPPDSNGINGLWHFNDDLSDGMANDDSGNGNEGTCTIGVTCPDYIIEGQRFGAGAYLFNGVTDYIEIPQSTISTSGTISMWIKPTGMQDKTIMDATNDIGSNKYFFIDINDQGLLRFWMEDYNDADFRVDYDVSQYDPNDWYLVTGVWNFGSAPALELYFNGELVDSDTRASGPISVLATPYIGHDRSEEDTNTMWKFGGAIDEAAIWSINLNQEEILALYSGGGGGPSTGSYESTLIETPQLESVLVEWESTNNNAIHFAISPDSNIWCNVYNGQIITRNNCGYFPSENFYYKVEFSDYSLINNVYFEWEERVELPGGGGGKTLPHQAYGEDEDGQLYSQDIFKMILDFIKNIFGL